MEDNMNNVANEEMVEIIPEEATTVEETKKGLTAGQKGIGITVIALAVLGIVEAVRYAVKGVKWAWNKIFGKNKTEAASKEEEKKEEPLPVTEVSNETMDEIQKEK